MAAAVVIGHTRALLVWAYTEPCEMRKSFNTLAALVQQELRREVLSGDLFLFVSRDRKRAKVAFAVPVRLAHSESVFPEPLLRPNGLDASE